MKKFILILIIALAFFACDDDNNTETHTHDYGTEWKSNATQHWKECSCGDKTEVADHDWGKWQETTPPTITSEGEEKRTCETCGATETQSIAKLQEHTYSYQTVTLPGPILNFQPENLPTGITYTLSDGTTTWNSVSGFNGIVSANSYQQYTTQTFTQTFYKGSDVIGSQVIKANVGSSAGNFTSLVNASNVSIPKIPDITLTY